MVMLCGLRYDRTIKEQREHLLEAIMNKAAGHPAALVAEEV
jgi:hypothetical protein